MNTPAFFALIACWILWVAPFLIHKVRESKRPAQLTVTASRWGIAIQTVAYFVAWYGKPSSRPLGVQFAGILFGALAVALSWTAIRNLGKQLRIHAGLYPDHELVRSGPYRIVRHPIYAGMLAIYLATALIYSNWITGTIGLVLMIVGTEIRVRIEDGLLASRFTEDFARYKGTTPAYIPFVR